MTTWRNERRAAIRNDVVKTAPNLIRMVCTAGEVINGKRALVMNTL